MVSVHASSAVDRGFEPRLGQTKDYKIGICCFAVEHTALSRKSKDCWLGIRIMCPSGATCSFAGLKSISNRARAHVGKRFGRRSRLVATHFALYQCQKRSGSRPVILPSRFANFNCFNGKTSVYFHYKIFVSQTAIVKGRNRNSYEYKNCTTDPYSGK